MAWKQRKLGEVCEVTMGQSPDGSTYSDEPSDYILVQGNADLKDGWVVPRVWTSQKTKTAQAGDLIMSVRAPVGAMGKTAYDIVIGRGVAAIKGNEFIYQTLVKYDADRYWKKLAAGSTFESVNSNEVKGAIINVPQDIEEQKKIGEYFLNLDHLITLNQQKITLLTKLKKAMLEKMFPKKGSVIPEIRFNGFANAWEQRKFDEVFDCTIPSNTLSRAELNYESGSVRNIHYGDILIKYGSVVDVKNDEIPFATGKSSEDFKSALLQDGDIIIADTAEDETTGKACEIGNSQGLDVVSGLHTMVCRPRNKMALGYLGYYLNSDAYHHQLLPLMQGIKVLSLSRTNVQKTMVCYPQSKAEQQLIADCFRNLDHLITLHQRKLDMLKKLKSACLSEMFI
ncbi:restriction endonuclease subunit S [Ligilactobacillus ruminis]|nr:restriction endonuclease subunit S [Ligilactobacillus ruminis]